MVSVSAKQILEKLLKHVLKATKFLEFRLEDIYSQHLYVINMFNLVTQRKYLQCSLLNTSGNWKVYARFCLKATCSTKMLPYICPTYLLILYKLYTRAIAIKIITNNFFHPIINWVKFTIFCEWAENNILDY